MVGKWGISETFLEVLLVHRSRRPAKGIDISGRLEMKTTRVAATRSDEKMRQVSWD